MKFSVIHLCARVLCQLIVIVNNLWQLNTIDIYQQWQQAWELLRHTDRSVSSWLLKMSWCQIGVRPSTTTMLNIQHYNEVIMVAIASQLTSLAIVFSTVYLDLDQRKHQSSASLAFVQGIHWRPVNPPNKWPVTRKMFPFDDVIMND